MKRLLILFTAVTAVAAAQGQPRPAPARMGAVNGQIVDGGTNKALQGAYIEFKLLSDTTVVRQANSQPDGKYTVANMPFGDYRVRVSYMGYDNFDSSVTVNMRNMTIAAFYLNQNSLRIEGAVVSAPMIRVSMHGDTIVYNAQAFKTSEDADAEAVIKQLPGAEVKDGTVKVQGKTVSKILVDNKETYGTDVSETMKTIPANMLEKIEVFDKLSDFAETTGINDGDDYTVMNFVTGIKFALFGEASAMYGHKDMYAAGARFNIVTGGHRFGINGGANNTGAASSFGDLQTPGMFGGGGYGAMTGSRGGSSAGNKVRNASSGLTYNYEKDENFRFNTNYSFRHSKNGSLSESETWYLNNPLFARQTSWTQSTTKNDGHNFGMSTRWRINKKNNVNARLMGTVSDSGSTSDYEQLYFEEALAEVVQKFAGNSLNSTDSYNIRLQANYGLQLGDKGRSLSIGIQGGASKSDGDSSSDALIRLLAKTQDSTSLSRSVNDSRRRNMQVRMRYYEPLNRYTHLSLNYDLELSHNDGNRRSETFAEAINQWNEWGAGSNVMTRNDQTHEYGVGINYNKNNNRLRGDVSHEIQTLSADSSLPRAWNDRKTWQFIDFQVEWRKQITPQKSFSIDLTTSSGAPSLDQIQDFDEISTSGQRVTGGNPRLRPTHSYETMLSYNNYLLASSTSFAIFASGNITANPIGTDKTTIAADAGFTTPNGTWLAKGTEYYRPVNMRQQQWNLNTGFSWGRPVKWLKSNFNTNLGIGYTETPGLANGQLNTARSQTYNWAAHLNTNFSEKMIIGAGYDVSFNYTGNTNALYSNYNAWTNALNFNFYWLTWKDFTVRANADYSITKVRSGSDYSYERLMANFALGKKLFKNKRGEISLAVNDIFNQRRSDNRNDYGDRITFNRNFRIGRYYSLTFIYRLRNFSREDGAGFGRGGRGGHGSRGGGRRIPINL